MVFRMLPLPVSPWSYWLHVSSFVVPFSTSSIPYLMWRILSLTFCLVAPILTLGYQWSTSWTNCVELLALVRHVKYTCNLCTCILVSTFMHFMHIGTDVANIVSESKSPYYFQSLLVLCILRQHQSSGKRPLQPKVLTTSSFTCCWSILRACGIELNQQKIPFSGKDVQNILTSFISCCITYKVYTHNGHMSIFYAVLEKSSVYSPFAQRPYTHIYLQNMSKPVCQLMSTRWCIQS